MVKSFVLYLVLLGWCATAAVLGWNWFDAKHDLRKTANDLTAANTSLDTCRQNESLLTGTISLQNDRVGQLQAAGVRAASAASQALATAKQVSDARQAEINRLQRRISTSPVQGVPPATCSAVIQELQRDIP
jgi:hypothetical protein